FILIGCQLQEPSKNHGIVFLENRAKKLEINTSNTNDVIKIIGQPHSKSINNDKEWIYIERILTKGEYHKLGQNVLKSNNILILNFDKYGVLKKKKILSKEDKQKILFSEKTTENELTQKSFVERFLSSIKAKMYGNK
ncbi:outer membrane protein assembly factor BamE, partial [bacterium]|nr:outer membrane protein assembly factor BamE [bacterium]